MDITDTLVSIASILNNANTGLIKLSWDSGEELTANKTVLDYTKDSLKALSERIERIEAKEVRI